ncbi:MAG: ATP-binding cassette domain-containing protein [Anaerolineae bacterium]|nr:ATP-binding cassette domain-containing protein [Anaerolineae bacterium]
MSALVEFNNVTYTYARSTKPAIEDISFSIEPGEFVALIGPSGAGKSTLCYCFNGSIPQLFNGSMSGNLNIAGCDPFEDDIPVLAQHVGLVVQNARTQLFNVTVIQEVGFGCENLGLPRPVILERVKQALDFVGLSGLEEREPTALSGGQQQRLAIACVLAMDPEILVLDEPTSELDPIGAEQVMDVIARMNQELGKTILLVTHDMEFVTKYASRVMLLNDRRLIMDGTPQEIFSKVELLAQSRIRPPQVCEVAEGLRQLGYRLDPLPVTLDDMVQSLKVLRHG